MNDIFTRLIDMDTGIAEQVVKNKDDTYTIFINSRLSHERQLEAYHHAMKHIDNDDFSKYDVQEIEYQVRVNCKEDCEPVPAKQYLDELMRLQRERKVLQRKIKQDEERIRFLQQNCDIFAIAEHQYLYSRDL